MSSSTQSSQTSTSHTDSDVTVKGNMATLLPFDNLILLHKGHFYDFWYNAPHNYMAVYIDGTWSETFSLCSLPTGCPVTVSDLPGFQFTSEQINQQTIPQDVAIVQWPSGWTEVP